MPPVSVLMKPASGLCNMSCDYCFYCDEAKNREKQSFGMMSRETLRNVIKKTMFNAQGYVSFLYQGGEPTLCGLDFFRDAVELQRKYNRNGVRIYNSLQTNGYAIDEEWCRFFKQEEFLIGLSVDGTEQLHDKYRHDKQGGGTYERVMRAANLLDKFGVEYNILTVVTRDVAENIEQIYREYRGRNWRFQQYIPCLNPLGEERQQEYSLRAEEYGAFLTKLFHLWYADYEKGCEPYIREFSNYIRMLKGYLPESCAMRGVCSVQNVVEADGSVYPCDFYALDEFLLGNYNVQRYAEIQGSPAAAAFVERSRKLSEECRGCEYFYLCKGGCQRNRVRVAGEDFYRNELCEGYRRFFKACLEKLKSIAE